jgi:hypothetical protein
MTHASVDIQIAPESVPSLPCWFGEVALVAQVFTTSGLLKAIEEQVRFTRPRFGTYEVIDFVVVLLGYSVSGEATLLAFYERLTPFASAFMALFDRQALPHRSTERPLSCGPGSAQCRGGATPCFKRISSREPFRPFHPGDCGIAWVSDFIVIDVDGTKQAGRLRALPQTRELPAPHRRFDQVCARGYLGRKRGEVARTRTTVLQAHSHHWLGTFGGPGNGDYRGELARALEAIISYAGWLCMPLSQVLVRLDGLYGNGAVLKELLQSGVGVIV